MSSILSCADGTVTANANALFSIAATNSVIYATILFLVLWQLCESYMRSFYCKQYTVLGRFALSPLSMPIAHISTNKHQADVANERAQKDSIAADNEDLRRQVQMLKDQVQMLMDQIQVLKGQLQVCV